MTNGLPIPSRKSRTKSGPSEGLPRFSRAVEGAEDQGLSPPGLLHYEGWSGFCLDDVLESLPPDVDVEEELFDAANDRSQGVIDEWVEENAPEFALVRSGHERTGLYGVTWALFKKNRRR